jgi:hypothetical protein
MRKLATMYFLYVKKKSIYSLVRGFIDSRRVAHLLFVVKTRKILVTTINVSARDY